MFAARALVTPAGVPFPALVRRVATVRASVVHASVVHASVVAHHLAAVAVILVSTLTPVANFQPTAGKLPGGATLQTLVDGLGGWGLILALAGLVLGAALWAVGAHSQNYQQSFVGRRAVLVSGLAALLIGAAPVIVDFFFHTGTGIHNPLAG